MMKVYFDNAATTPIAKEVLDEMLPYMTEFFGNPSSIHSYGRKTRAAIEKARKIVATNLNCSTSEIFFTSCGTESNNTALKCAVRDLGVKRVVSTKIEHHCVLHSVEFLERNGVEVVYLNLDEQGHIDFAQLEELLSSSDTKTMVSLMHANNEIGTLLNLERVSALCEKYNAYFHSDTVQTIGYYPFDLQKLKVHFLSGSSHKFHGPKGIGFLYINSASPIHPFIDGGSQERNMRSGTENLYGIVGLGKALDLAYENLEAKRTLLSGLKQHMMQRLKEELLDVQFNGDAENGLYRVLNVSLPNTKQTDLVLFNLDMAGIAASGGSACTSGSDVGSHVLAGIKADPNRKSVRFSFSRYNTKEEVDYVVDKLKEMC